MIVGDHLLAVVISPKPLAGLLLSGFRICYIVYGKGSMPLPLLPCRCTAIHGRAFSFWDSEFTTRLGFSGVLLSKKGVYVPSPPSRSSEGAHAPPGL